MKNVTIALDDDVHRKARIRAAELGTSLSALVKQYLTGLVAEGGAPAIGVREMQAPYKHAEPDTGPPWLVNGEWVYTKDGKPRQPGALRKPGKMVDLPDWPDGFWDFLDEAPEDDPNFDPLPFDESQLRDL
ncbi:MAG TPA: hypothetical protein VF418_11075 [Sphingomonadaceae bacterium]